VFEAFVTVFRRKSERFLRVAGIAPDRIGQADLSDALVSCLAAEASDVASRMLDICIRAIDYCPPIDLRLGEYLRAIVTADADVVAADRWGFREALMRSFRRRDIFPDGVRYMTEDALRWEPPPRELVIEALAFRSLRFAGDPGRPIGTRRCGRPTRSASSSRFRRTPGRCAASHRPIHPPACSRCRPRASSRYAPRAASPPTDRCCSTSSPRSRRR
jgi:hypothetical protein